MCFSSAPQDMSNLQGVAREENVQAMEVSSHLVTAEAGEDVRMNILSFCRQRPGHIAILSATGTFSSVTIEDPSMAGMTQTYEWGFSVLSVSGIFMPLEGMVDNEGRPGGINVIIGRQDGRVVGGRVAGPLIAASPVQVVMLATDPENAD